MPGFGDATRGRAPEVGDDLADRLRLHADCGGQERERHPPGKAGSQCGRPGADQHGYPGEAGEQVSTGDSGDVPGVRHVHGCPDRDDDQQGAGRPQHEHQVRPVPPAGSADHGAGGQPGDDTRGCEHQRQRQIDLVPSDRTPPATQQALRHPAPVDGPVRSDVPAGWKARCTRLERAPSDDVDQPPPAAGANDHETAQCDRRPGRARSA